MHPDVRAQAVCSCGGARFRVYIYKDGTQWAYCVACDKAWKAPSQGFSKELVKDETVGSRGPEPGDVVQKAAEALTSCPACMSRRAAKAAAQKRYRAKQRAS